MESSLITIAPLLLRNLITSMFIYADKSLLHFTHKFKFLRLLRSLIVAAFLFFLRLLSSLFPSLNPSEDNYKYSLKPQQPADNYVPAIGIGGGGDSGIARALSQLLSIVNNIPVSSRKYEVVRSLAETLLDDNLREGNEVLREVNRTVLSAAFSRTLNQLETAVIDQKRNYNDVTEGTVQGDYYVWNRVLRTVRYCGDAMWRFGKPKDGMNRMGSSAEKFAAELHWYAQKLAACGCAEEAVTRWALASNLAWLAIWAEPRLQGSIVKVSAFLFKQAKEIGEEEGNENTKEQQRLTNMKMLMSWLPLLCRASNGTDAPVLNTSERAELEKTLETIIENLEEVEQEKVLSLWLHHFTYCASTDWPNLHACYTRWCTASRKLLVLVQ